MPEKPKRQVNKIACVECRKNHSKCDLSQLKALHGPGVTKCSRCQRMGLDCIVIQGKKRGRKKKNQTKSTSTSTKKKQNKRTDRSQTVVNNEPKAKRRRYSLIPPEYQHPPHLGVMIPNQLPYNQTVANQFQAPLQLNQSPQNMMVDPIPQVDEFGFPEPNTVDPDQIKHLQNFFKNNNQEMIFKDGRPDFNMMLDPLAWDETPIQQPALMDDLMMNQSPNPNLTIGHTPPPPGPPAHAPPTPRAFSNTTPQLNTTPTQQIPNAPQHIPSAPQQVAPQQEQQDVELFRDIDISPGIRTQIEKCNMLFPQNTVHPNPLQFVQYITHGLPEQMKANVLNMASRTKDMEFNSKFDRSNDEEFQQLAQEVKRLRKENARKQNEVQILVTMNEALRFRVQEVTGQLKKRTESDILYPENPNKHPRMKTVSSLAQSFQELCSLMEHREEMDKSEFGNMVAFPGGRLIHCNDKLMNYLGYELNDLHSVVERWEDVIHKNSFSVVVNEISKALSGKARRGERGYSVRSLQCNLFLRHKSGAKRPALMYMGIVGGLTSYIPVFVVSYFAFQGEQQPNTNTM